MFTRWYDAGWLLCVVVASCSLETRYAQTASNPAAAGSGAPIAPPVGACPASLAERLSVTHVDVDTDIRYRVPRYDGYPIDERIALAVARDGRAYVAWMDSSSQVRVTPLDASLARREPDIAVRGVDFGGIVAHEDGFALLTRREDPGEPLIDPNASSPGPARAAFLVRYRDRTQEFAVPLTGTASITAPTDPGARDCSSRSLNVGKLAWNGVRYGAYFQVHGCAGDPHQGEYADKLVYADTRGRLALGGRTWICSVSLGIRLLAEPGPFTSVCLSDRLPSPGLNLVTDGVPPRQLSAEYTSPSYVSAGFGSIAKIPADGSYALGWLSRGIATVDGSFAAAKPAYDIALLRLSADYEIIGRKKWLVETPDVAELNLHLAAYGRDRLLAAWERIENPRCGERVCYGPYSGTVARLLDLDGNPLSADESLLAPPNAIEDLVTFPNGDLGWAFVEDENRSYESSLIGAPPLPAKRQLSIARFRVCE